MNIKRITIGVIFCLYVLNCAFSASSMQVKIDNIISELNQKFPVKFTYDTIPKATWQEVDYLKIDESDYRDLYRFLKLLEGEINKYPPKFFESIGLKYIAIVKKLNHSGQHRAALPDAYKEILFYDILRGRCDSLWTGVRDRYYIVHAIHHEIYHMCEQEINGNFFYKDSIWNSYNDTAFQYGKGGADFYPDMKQKHKRKYRIFSKRPFEITHPTKGITSIYAATGLEEDKAEIFASLFISREERKVNRLMKKDDIIRRKKEYLKKFLESICEEMSENYWKKIT